MVNRLEAIEARLAMLTAVRQHRGMKPGVLTADLAALLAVVRAIEAEMVERACPLCQEGYVHKPDCPMALLLEGR